MKITGYDQESGSILAAFASDTTLSQNPADYNSVAVQVDSSEDIESIKRTLARVGLQTVRAQEYKEQITINHDKIAEIVSLIGQEFTYDITEFEPAATEFKNEVQL